MVSEAVHRKVSRRNFLFTSSLLAAAGATMSTAASKNFLLSPTLPQDQQGESSSGLATGKLKPLKYKELAGFLSEAQLTPHHQAHYGGYVKTLGAIEQAIEKADRSKSNASFSDYRSAQKELTFAVNGILLHELYFDNMAPKPAEPKKDVEESLKKRFGSLDKWVEDFKAAANAARGWAVLAYCPANQKLYNFVSDAHDVGAFWTGIPLVVIDTYEHAYYVDYKNKKGDYVSKFPNHIDWSEVSQRWSANVKK